MKFSKKGQTKFSWWRISQSEIQIQRQQKDRKRKARASRNPPPNSISFCLPDWTARTFCKWTAEPNKGKKEQSPLSHPTRYAGDKK